MERQIIQIDESKCNGCGRCASACAEGAIQMVDGKARLISEIFCDGLGACIGQCPVDAIRIERREAEPYSERETMEQLLPQGLHVVALHLEHLRDHGQQKLFEEGIAILREKGEKIPDFDAPALRPETKDPGTKSVSKPIPSGLPVLDSPCLKRAEPGKRSTNWPIQLQLINPNSEIFDDADIVIAADCTAFSLPGFYRQFTQNHVLIVFCPKLDRATELYVEKLATIFRQHSVRSVTLLRMLVPCCGGTSVIVRQALQKAGKEIDVAEHIVDFDGSLA